MNATVHEQLIRTEQQFLLAVVSGNEESYNTFSQEWSQLARDVENTKAAGRLDDNTAHLLSEVSQAIENMAVCVLESGDILQESLNRSIGDFIQDIPSGDLSIALPHSQAIAPYHLLFSSLSSSRNSTILGQKNLLDSYAYCWLMQNIHDPYPNSLQMQIICNVSGTSTAQVDLWFQEARESIGWNKLSRNFFAGSVNATVAAARHVYLERDRNIPFDVVFAFSTVKAFAETLFLENPLLQGKDVDMGSAQAIRTMAMDQGRHMGSLPGELIFDPEGMLVPPQVNIPAPPDPLSDLSDGDDESEEEDTTPPPSIVGCKRLLAEDEFTSQAADLGRPQKRLRCADIFPLSSFLRTEMGWCGRTWSINWTPSGPECLAPLPSTFGVSSEQTTHMSATPVLPFPSLHPLSPTLPEYLPGPPSITDTDVMVHGYRKRRLSQCVSPAPSKRQRRLSISGTNSTPSSDECRGRPTDPDEFLQSMLPVQVPIDSDVPVNLGVYDWNSIPDPLAGMASSICMLSTLPYSNSPHPLYASTTGRSLCFKLRSRISAPRAPRSWTRCKNYVQLIR